MPPDMVVETLRHQICDSSLSPPSQHKEVKLEVYFDGDLLTFPSVLNNLI